MCKSCDAPRVAAAVAALVEKMQGSPLVSLVTVRDEIDAQLVERVADLRQRHGWTWAQIGQSLGMTRQAAQQRYGVKP